MTIWFDMDGTIADLYGVEGWLEMLMNSDPTPYKVAKPLVRLSSLARRLNKLQKQGYEIGIISWLSKSGSDDYNLAVTETKIGWLNKHLPSVKWNVVNIVKYGYCKDNFNTGNDILFDDEAKNRDEWSGTAYDVDQILATLANLE